MVDQSIHPHITNSNNPPISISHCAIHQMGEHTPRWCHAVWPWCCYFNPARIPACERWWRCALRHGGAEGHTGYAEEHCLNRKGLYWNSIYVIMHLRGLKGHRVTERRASEFGSSLDWWKAAGFKCFVVHPKHSIHIYIYKQGICCLGGKTIYINSGLNWPVASYQKCRWDVHIKYILLIYF